MSEKKSDLAEAPSGHPPEAADKVAVKSAPRNGDKGTAEHPGDEDLAVGPDHVEPDFEASAVSPVRAVYDFFRSTSVWLTLVLITLAVMTIAGALPSSQQDILVYKQAHPFISPVFEKLGFFKLYSTLWFKAVAAITALSLVVCLTPPTAAMVGIYRFLRSMRTALVLLLILAIASIVGTFVPQEAQQAQAVAAWKQNYPNIATVFGYLQLFDVYGAWWFQVLIALLMASLLSCVIPRTKAVVKKLFSKQPAVTERFLDNLGHSLRLEVSLPVDEALEKAGDVLRKHGFRPQLVECGDEEVNPATGKGSAKPAQLFARKGRFGDVGSLLFHYSFIILLVAAIWGKASGFEGRAFIIEGERWVEQHLQYDSLTEGKLYASKDDHKGFEVQVDDFTASYWGRDRNFMAKDFVSTASIFDNGKLIEKERIRVNGKLYYKGVKFYQSSYGWAPHITVKQTKENGKKVDYVLYDKPTVFFSQGVPPMDAQGQFTIPENPDPDDPDQLFIDAVFVPDIRITATGAQLNSPYLKNPALMVRLYKGPNRTLLKQEFVTKDQPVADFGDYQITMPEVKEWTGLEVNSDPGVPAIYTAFTIMVLGVLVALYMTHRRVWVAAMPSQGGKKSTLIVAGIAEKNKNAFALEFEELEKDMIESLPGKPRTGKSKA